MLADLKLAEKQNVLAEKLLLLGKRRFPVARSVESAVGELVCQRKKTTTKLEPVLIELFAMQEDDVSLPAKLAEIAMARKDSAAAERWSRAALQIDVKHAASHAGLATGFAAAGKPARLCQNGKRQWKTMTSSLSGSWNWQTTNQVRRARASPRDTRKTSRNITRSARPGGSGRSYAWLPPVVENQ